MAITIRSSFVVDATPADAWRSLIDIELSAPCFPGAELQERLADGSYKGGFTVKLGPLTFKFNGKFKIASQDDANRTAVITASGTDTKGRGGADATINVAVVDEAGKSKVNVVSDVNLSGTVAQYGRGVGMIEALSQQLLNQFAKNLTARIEAEPASEPAAPAAVTGAGDGTAVDRGAATPPPAPVASSPVPESAATATPADAWPTSALASPPVEPAAPSAPAAPPAPAASSAPVAPVTSPAPAAAAPPAAAPQPLRRPPAPAVAPLDAGSLVRKAMWQSVRNFFARLFGSK